MSLSQVNYVLSGKEASDLVLNSDQIPSISSAFTGSGSDSQSPAPGSGNSGGESHPSEEAVMSVICPGYPGDSGTFCHSPDTSAPGNTPFTDRSVN